MEKKTDFLDKYKQLKTDDFIRFLDRNGVTDKCVACGHTASVVPETMKRTLANTVPDIYATVYRHSTVINTDHPQNYYYQIFCEKCGFGSTFNATVVFNWLEANQSKGGKDDPSA